MKKLLSILLALVLILTLCVGCTKTGQASGSTDIRKTTKCSAHTRDRRLKIVLP